MKKKYLLLFLLNISIGFAQIPTGYYNTATGSGFVLKTQLYNIIKDHTDQGYNSMDNFFLTGDLDVYTVYENDGSILDIYSENPTGIDPYNYSPNVPSDACGNYSAEGDCYNKEHVIPQSIFSQANPMRGDAHHVLPTDGRVNGFRSNYPFGIVGNNLVSQSGISNPTQNGSKLGGNINTGIAAGYSGTVFEPIDEFKGDIARVYFYFVTRYENLVSNWSSYAMFDGSSNKVIDSPFLDILYQWHINDPVSTKEVNRNNAIYNYQNNRNPFVDHPEYVYQIWGAFLNSTNFNNLNTILVYPNPSNENKINIETDITLNEIQLININGQIIKDVFNPEFSNNQYSLNNLPQGFYLLRLSSENQSIVKKIIVN